VHRGLETINLMKSMTAMKVKLKDDPLMSYHRISNRPPVWTQTRNGNVITITGEVGVLIHVHSNSLRSNKFFLVVNHGGELYVGTLIFENHAASTSPRFCKAN
jgi:hypothetical protein